MEALPTNRTVYHLLSRRSGTISPIHFRLDSLVKTSCEALQHASAQCSCFCLVFALFGTVLSFFLFGLLDTFPIHHLCVSQPKHAADVARANLNPNICHESNP